MGDNKLFGLSQAPIGGMSQFLLTADASHNGDVAYEQHFLNVYIAAAKPKLFRDVGEGTNESAVCIRSTRRGGDLLVVGIADAFGGGTGSLFADYVGRKLAEAAEAVAGKVKPTATNATHQIATLAFSEVADAIKGSKMGFDTLTSVCHSALIFKRGATLSIYSAGSLSIVAAGADLWGKQQTRVLIGPLGRGPATAEKAAGFVPASGDAGGAAADGASRPLGGEALGAGPFQLSSTSLTLQPTDAVVICVTGVDWELFFPEELGLMAFRALAGGLDAGSAALKVASEVEERARLLGTDASEGLQCTCLIIVNPAANGIGKSDVVLGPASSMNSSGRPSATPAITSGSRSSGASASSGLSNGPGGDAHDAGGKRGILGWIKTRLNKKEKKVETMNREAMAVLKEASVHRGARPSAAALYAAQNRPNRLGSQQGGAQDYSTRRGSAGYPSAAALAPPRKVSIIGGRMEARRSSLGISGAGGAAPNAATPPMPIPTRGAASPFGLGLQSTDSPSPINLYRGVNSVNEYMAPRRTTGAVLETARGSAGANTNYVGESAGKQGLRRTSLGAPRATGALVETEDNGALLNSYLDKEKARTASKKRFTLETASRVASITYGGSKPKRDAISGTGAAVGGPPLSGKANANNRPVTEAGAAAGAALRSGNAYNAGSYGSPDRMPPRSTNGLGPGGNLVLTPDAVQAFTAIVKIDEEPYAVIRGGAVSNPAAPPRRSSVGFRLPGEGVKASYRVDMAPALPGTVEGDTGHGSGLDFQMEAAYFNAPPKTSASRTDNT